MDSKIISLGRRMYNMIDHLNFPNSTLPYPLKFQASLSGHTKNTFPKLPQIPLKQDQPNQVDDEREEEGKNEEKNLAPEWKLCAPRVELNEGGMEH